MQNMNFSKNISNLRKIRGITQEELANHLGITKAAVSKWEKNQSYPDITLLPIIAAYFDISIDELLGYEPFMEEDEVKKLYTKFIEDFATKDFDEVYNKCIYYEKKYYTCYFLQFHLGLLYCNHAYLAGDQEKIINIYKHTVKVFERIEENCEEVNLAKEALTMKSYCNLIIGKADDVIDDLKGISKVPMPLETILSKAYQIKGDKEEAIKTLQIFIFNNFINSIQAMTDILSCYEDNEEKQKMYIDKLIKIVDVLDLKNEYPQALLNAFTLLSLTYGSKGDKENCLKYLQECVDMVSDTNVFDFKENKNKMFDYLPEFIEGMKIGNILPRNEELIVESLRELIETHPGFTIIRDDIMYDNLLKKLNKFRGK